MSAFHQGIFFAVTSSICSSLSLILYSQAAKYLSPLLATVGSSVFGMFALGGILWLQGALYRLPEAKKFWKEISLIGLLRFGVGGYLLALSLTLTTSVNVMLLAKAEPYLVLLWFWLFEKGKVGRFELIMLGIHIVGAWLLSTGGRFVFEQAQMGDLVLLAGIFFYSLTYLLGKKVSQGIGAPLTSLLSQMAGALILVPILIFFWPETVHWQSRQGWMSLLVTVILFNVFGITLWYAALSRLRSWLVSALRVIGPLVAVPVAWIFLGEALSPVQVLGGLIVITTSALLVRQQSRE